MHVWSAWLKNFESGGMSYYLQMAVGSLTWDRAIAGVTSLLVLSFRKFGNYFVSPSCSLDLQLAVAFCGF